MALSIILAACLIGVSAHADDEGLYGTFSLGAAIPEVDIAGADPGTSGDWGLALGYQTSKTFRWDIAEVHYMNTAGIDLGFATSRSNLTLGTTLNWGWFDPKVRLQPFVSLGIGAARLRYQEPGSTALNDSWAFDWNLGGGVSTDLSDKLRTGLRYRYRRTNRNNANTAYSVEIHSISVEFSYVGGS
jgi:opacity protein-like surface antigen